jgi:2-methylcitrate dehydratase PrpD
MMRSGTKVSEVARVDHWSERGAEMTEPDVTRILARFIKNTTFESLPPEVVARAKLCLLDCLFVTLGGYRSGLPAVRILTDYVRETGGAHEARILGDGSLVPCEYATMVNSVASEILELSDGDPKIIGHAGQAVIPAAIAAAEKEKATGKQLLAAIVVGYDVMVRVGYAVIPSAFDRGLSASGCLSSFGAAAAAGKILNLSEQQVGSALGLAAFGSGFRESWTGTGTMDKDFMVGDAARRGLVAAVLAKKGLSGAPNILEGPRGFCRTVADNVDFSETLRGLGQVFTIMNQYLKPYPSCRHTHATIDAVRAILKKQPIEAGDLERVTIYLNEHAAAIAMAAPTTYVGIRFSQQFAAAVTFLTGQATLEQFTEEMAVNPEVRRLLEIIGIKVDPVLDKSWPEKWASRVEAKLKNGKSVVHQIDYPKGEVTNPMDEEEMREKYISLLGGPGSSAKVNRIMEQTSRIEELIDVNEFTLALSQ